MESNTRQAKNRDIIYFSQRQKSLPFKSRRILDRFYSTLGLPRYRTATNYTEKHNQSHDGMGGKDPAESTDESAGIARLDWVWRVVGASQDKSILQGERIRIIRCPYLDRQ